MARYKLLSLRQAESESEPVTEVNIIPVIDISLVLLVILFVTAPLLAYPTLPVALPPASALPNQELTIALTCALDGVLSVRAGATTWDTVVSDLRREVDKKNGAVVLIRADKSVPYRTIQRLIAVAKSAGAAQIALATEPVKK